ncbi:MAG TPA: BON domain-containing protein [Nitrospira sp.]|nr:BON domain-containing protein [Nitrospira sp.]
MNGFAWPKRLHLGNLILGVAFFLVPPPSWATVNRTATPFTAPEASIARDAIAQRIKDTAPAADDTGRNERDREGQTMTPLDQSNDPKDVKITQKIRKALVADDALSITAKNIKIITVHGKVILRGPVANVQEKKKIAKMAQKFTKQRVLNELEVAAQ